MNTQTDVPLNIEMKQTQEDEIVATDSNSSNKDTLDQLVINTADEHKPIERVSEFKPSETVELRQRPVHPPSDPPSTRPNLVSTTLAARQHIGIAGRLQRLIGPWLPGCNIRNGLILLSVVASIVMYTSISYTRTGTSGTN